MIITGFALYIAVLVNGEEYEAIPAVYSTVEECLENEKLYTAEIVEASSCFHGEFLIRDKEVTR